MADAKQQVHIVLVHGICHGAWCWYKLQPLLEAAGHRVTVLDLAASGIDRRNLEDLHTFIDYSQPLLDLMASIPPEEKVVLVGHSLGGMNLAFAMDMYPEKIKVAVFLTALMPDTTNKPSYVAEQSVAEISPEEWLDTEFKPFGSPEENLTSLSFGPKFISTKLYPQSPVELLSGISPEEWLDTEFKPFGSPEENLTSLLFGPNYISTNLYPESPAEDVALANTLVRPSSLFLPDLENRNPFSKERYGSVKRVFILCLKDRAIPIKFQRWEISNFAPDQVKEIDNSDHMVMISAPQDLFQRLLEIIADYYA
ncbi:UNVERIFIED_CONTAM: Salicylic acid-binding protein 2 [Sesamum radiatum]|uniref:Salicylic acid-binding protein 2 n=1 Tax=Sesamum radiatum TaxID=300843 RepID=A0AAW2RCQ8_SESRA